MRSHEDHPKRLTEFFERSVRSHPHGVAVEIPPGHDRPERIAWTYRELDDAASAWVERLGPVLPRNAIVALLLPRSDPQLYAAQLGILRVGAAYVCLDPAFPKVQMLEILSDSGAVGLVTTRELHADRLGPLPDAIKPFWVPHREATPDGRRVNGANHKLPEAGLLSPYPPSPNPGDLAYLIYTSGTTGKPKGVMIEHAGIANLVGSDLDEFRLGPEDRVGQSSSSAYDSSVEEIWLAWASGATLVILDDATVRLGPDLTGWLRKERITVLCPPGTLLRTTACEDPAKELPDLRLLYVGGEALPRDVADRWAPGRRMVNGYGPTECSVTALRADVIPGQPVTIGTPIPGLRALLLDEQLEPSAEGESGELCLTGVGLARGYHRLPELTEERFPLHPVHGRVYRTGDLAKKDGEGRFYCLGRRDEQVKIRGYRIEVEAVEARLAECDGVLEAACVARSLECGGYLEAHIVPRNPASLPSIENLRSALSLTLPAYMVPLRFGWITELPRTAGGKISRKALPLLPEPEGHETCSSVPAQTPAEIRLVEALAKVFSSRSTFSMDQDFFLDLGGDSLSAALVVSALRRAGNPVSIAVRDLYEARTLANIALRLECAGQDEAASESRSPSGLGSVFWASLVQGCFTIAALAAAGVVWYGLLWKGIPWLESVLGWRLVLLLLAPMAVVLWIMLVPVSILATVAAKKILIGRYRPAEGAVYGSLYLRHWMVQQVARCIPWSLLAGTEFACHALRALGAKVGRRVHIHRGVNLVQGGWDLLEIGDDVTLNQNACLRLFELESRTIKFDYIRIESGATVELHAGVGRGCWLGAQSRLEAMACLSQGEEVPAGEIWQGVPARKVGVVDSKPRDEVLGRRLSPAWHGVCVVAAYAVLFSVLSLPAEMGVLTLGQVAGISDGSGFVRLWGSWSGLAWLVAIEMTVVPLTLGLAALMLRGMGRVPLGVMDRWDPAFVRVWIKTGVTKLAGDWLYGTLMWPWWLRWAGAKVGRGAEISGLIDGVPEHLEIGDRVFCADGIYAGGPRIDRGRVNLHKVQIGSNSFIGNGAVLGSGEVVPGEMLVGICTVAGRAELKTGEAWFGDPPFALPRREVVQLDERLTHRPSPLRIASRIFWETARFALPLPLLAALGCWVAGVEWGEARFSAPVFFGLWMPGLAVAALAIPFGVALALKWILLGKVRPRVHALWSCWASRWDFVCMGWSILAVDLVALVEGTPLLPWLLRSAGMKVGRGVVFGGEFAHDMADPDMFTFEDGATVDGMFQAHTFEDRALKMDPIVVRAGATIGRNALLLYGAEVGAEAHVLPHSVVMKHEHLLPGKVYQGFPTRPQLRWPARLALCLCGLLGYWASVRVHAARPPRPVVEVEEQVYTFVPANNGAGPMWCAGSTCLVRVGNKVFASGLETLEGVQPLNNCRWVLYERSEQGWKRTYSDPEGRTREPSPLVVLRNQEVVLSANPTLGTKPEPNGGAARPELFRFRVSEASRPPERSLPVWGGQPRFTEHSYRSFASDSASGNFLLMQNIGYTHAEWSFSGGQGKRKAHGQLQWPWGSDYDQPQPVRTCYPAVAIRDRAVHFFGVSDVLEPNKTWREFKRQLTGQAWDYDFRRLFYTWTPDVSARPFAEWIEIASRDRTGGFVWPCDLWLSPGGDVHLLWTERAIDERLREKFFPQARQSHGLYYGVLKDGKWKSRRTLMESTEDAPGAIGSAARFHEAPGRRTFVTYYVAGKGSDGASLSENRVQEVFADGTLSTPLKIPFLKPFTSYFTATPRAGSKPSKYLDFFGHRTGESTAISYGRVRLF